MATNDHISDSTSNANRSALDANANRTGTVSQTTSKNILSRRAMLGRIPAAALATTTILPIKALADAPSQVERLYTEWNPIRKAALAAYAAESPLVAAFDDFLSDPPDVLRWHPATDIIGFDKLPSPENPGKYRLFVRQDEESIQELREIASGERSVNFGDPDWHQKRAAELLAAITSWKAKCERHRREIGLVAAEDAANAAGDADYGMADRILALPVTNVRDLAYRAAVAREHDYTDTDETAFLLDRLIEVAGISV